jgi:hypothetical protein
VAVGSWEARALTYIVVEDIEEQRREAVRMKYTYLFMSTLPNLYRIGLKFQSSERSVKLLRTISCTIFKSRKSTTTEI